MVARRPTDSLPTTSRPRPERQLPGECARSDAFAACPEIWTGKLFSLLHTPPAPVFLLVVVVPHSPDFSALAAQTQDVYERQAERFDAERARALIERKWLRRFEELLPQRATILDVGCGAGEPIAQYFIGQGHRLTGIDYAACMIDRVRARFPAHAWQLGDMRQLDLGQRFDGLIGWHSFFHLTPDEQRQTLPRLAAHLDPGGALMLTVGPEAGEVVGHVGGEAVYHSSLAQREYQEIFQSLGLEVVDFVPEDPECDHASVLLAQKGTCERNYSEVSKADP